MNRFTIGSILGATGIAISSILWVSFGKGNPVPVPAYTVQRVIDGDTFVTTESQYIRVAGIEAPEMGVCGAEEAKAKLESMILKKPVMLKVLYRDPYSRLVSMVYTQEGYVNEALLKQGFAYYQPRGKADNLTDLKKAGEYSREKQLGIFSTSCTQADNPTDPKCTIKGNTRNGNIYYMPSCGVYPNTVVQLYLGDQWFCSEKEAMKAGFRKPEQCK